MSFSGVVRKGSNARKGSNTLLPQRSHSTEFKETSPLSQKDKSGCEAIYAQFKTSVFDFLNEYNDTQLLRFYQIFQDPTSKQYLNLNESKDVDASDTIYHLVNALKTELVQRIFNQYENNIYCLNRYDNSELLSILKIFQDTVISQPLNLSEVKDTYISDTVNNIVNNLKSEIIERLFKQYKKSDDFLDNYNESELEKIFEILADEENINTLDINDVNTINNLKTKAINKLGQDSNTKRTNPNSKNKRLSMYNTVLDLMSDKRSTKFRKLVNVLYKGADHRVKGSHKIFLDPHSNRIVAVVQPDSGGVKKYQQRQIKEIAIANLADQKEDSIVTGAPTQVFIYKSKGKVIPNADQKKEDSIAVDDLTADSYEPEESVDLVIPDSKIIKKAALVEPTNLNKVIAKVVKYLNDINVDNEQINYKFIMELEKLDNNPDLENSLNFLEFLSDCPYDRIKLEYELVFELVVELVNITPEITVDAFITLVAIYSQPKHRHQIIETLLIEKGIKQDDMSAACQLMASLKDEFVFIDESADEGMKNRLEQILINKMFELSKKGNIESLSLLRVMQLSDLYSLKSKSKLIKNKIVSQVEDILKEKGDQLHPIVKIQVMQGMCLFYLKEADDNIKLLEACKIEYDKLLEVINDALKIPQFALVATLNKRCTHHNIGALYQKMYSANRRNPKAYYDRAIENYSLSAKSDSASCYNMASLYFHNANKHYDVSSLRKGLYSLQRGILLGDKACFEYFFHIIAQIKTDFSWIKKNELDAVNLYISKLISLTNSFFQEYELWDKELNG